VGLLPSGHWSLGCLAALAVGCGQRSSPGFETFEPVDSDAAAISDASLDSDIFESEAAAASDGPLLSFTQDATSSEASTSDCSDEATAYVFVLSNANDLYRFAPDKKVFTKIGALGCVTSSGPNSMAVDRHATAWVNYLDGTIRSVSTTDASCQGPSITLPPAWTQIGMGFSSAGAGSTTETLYIAGAGAAASSGFASVDLVAGTVAPIGQFTAGLTGIDAELTGTGDGRLFGFFAATPVQLGQIDKASGSIASATPLTQIGTPSDFAFSFWGGRFYLYTYPNATGTSTNVTEYDPVTGAVNTTYMTDIGFLIVGAGVSTCAPTTPPAPK